MQEKLSKRDADELAERDAVEQQRNSTSPQFKDAEEKAKKGLDDILGEIDEVLEENAEEFVNGFLQSGGE